MKCFGADSCGLAQLTNCNTRKKSDIERVQKTCLKVIFGTSYTNYESALKQSNLTSLDERRKELCISFAKKCIANENTKDMFPLKPKNANWKTRFPEKYTVYHANTERLQRSPIIYMQKLLNEIET